MSILHLLLFLSGVVAAAAVAGSDATIDVPKSEPEQVDAALHALEEDGHFSAYLSLLRAHNTVLKTFKSLSGLTLLVPMDDAFGEESFQSYLKKLSRRQVVRLLKFHALPKYYSQSQLESVFGKNTTTVASGKRGKTFFLVVHSDYTISTTVNSAKIQTEAFDAFPVVVYVIDKVLIPADIVIPSPPPPPVSPPPPPSQVSLEALGALQRSPFFKTLLYLLEISELTSEVESLPGYTLFAPTNLAFRSLPAHIWHVVNTRDVAKQLIKYHVVQTYYPPWFLGHLKAPVPTWGTSTPNASDYQLRITYLGGLKVMIETGLVKSFITGVVFNRKPVVIYSVDHVLLPKEIFG